MKNYLNKAFRFGINITKKEGDVDGEFYVEGYASTSDLDRQGDVITREALEGASNDLENKTAFYGHNYDLGNAVGLVANTGIDDIGLKVRIYVSKWAKELRTKLKEGVINTFSIGGQVLDGDTLSKEEAIKQGYISEEEAKEAPYDEIGIVKKLRLFEVSFVGVPANAHAQVTLAKALKKIKEKNIKKIEHKKEEIIENNNSETEKSEEDKMKQDELLDKETYFECSSCDWSGESDELKDQLCPECGIEVGELPIESEETSEKEEEKKEIEEKSEEKSEEKEEKQEYECECLECGHTLKTDEHCKDLECPECGGEMRRKDRPGSGKKEETEEISEKEEKEAEKEETKEAEPEEEKEIEEKEKEIDSLKKEIGDLKESIESVSGELKEFKEIFEKLTDKIEVIRVNAEKKSIIKDLKKKPKKKKEIDPDESFLKFLQDN